MPSNSAKQLKGESTMSYGAQVLIACAIPAALVIGTVVLTLAYALVFNK